MPHGICEQNQKTDIILLFNNFNFNLPIMTWFCVLNYHSSLHQHDVMLVKVKIRIIDMLYIFVMATIKRTIRDVYIVGFSGEKIQKIQMLTEYNQSLSFFVSFCCTFSGGEEKLSMHIRK